MPFTYIKHLHFIRRPNDLTFIHECTWRERIHSYMNVHTPLAMYMAPITKANE